MFGTEINIPWTAVFVLVLGTGLTYAVSKYKDWSAEKKAAIAEEKRIAQAEKVQAEKERRDGVTDRLDSIDGKIQALEHKGSADTLSLEQLKQEMLPMAEANKRRLIEILTHPGKEFEKADALLELVRPTGSALPPELRMILAERAVSESPFVTEQEKLAAQALPIIVRMAELEAQEAPNLIITGIQLVTSTAKSTETRKKEEGID